MPRRKCQIGARVGCIDPEIELTTAFSETIARVFPGAVPQKDFVEGTRERLELHRFTRDNTLACVAICRDEIAGPLADDVEDAWGPSFSLASLAGMLTAGRTGFSAAAHHGPVVDGKRRFVIYAMPHIAISAEGTIGEVLRPGVESPTAACGALAGFRKELELGTLDVSLDHTDVEQILLKQRLIARIRYGSVPSLEDLTSLVANVIEDDLRSIGGSLSADIDVAVLTGIQVHGPEGANFVQPRSAYVVLDGVSGILSPNATLTGTYWKLIAIGDDPAPLGAGNREVHLVLESQSSRARGFSGCNTFTGAFETTGREITFGPLAVTMRACFEGMDLEKRFLDAMDQARTFRIDGDSLTLLNSREEAALSFESVYLT